MAIKRWNANTSTWELVGTPGTVTPDSIGAAALSGNNSFSGNIGIGTAATAGRLAIKSGGDRQIDFLGQDGNTYAYIGTTGGIGSAPANSLKIRSDAGGIIFGYQGFEQARIDTSGRLGIGTSSPSRPLHIGNVSEGSGVAISGSAPNLSITNMSGTDPNNSSMTGILALSTAGGNYSNSAGDLMLALFGSSHGNIRIDANYANIGPTTHVVIQPTAGNVLIGTTTSDQILTIGNRGGSGNTRIAMFSDPNHRFYIYNNSLSGAQQSGIGQGGYMEQNSGGTYSGVKTYASFPSYQMIIRNEGFQGFHFMKQANGSTLTDGAITTMARIDENGYMYIGYTSSQGAYRLQVNSQIFATSSSIATSDGKYKENVLPITSGLDIIDSLNPVSFNWKEHPVHNFVPGKTVGFIAQEVKESLKDYEWVDNIIKTNTTEAVLDEEGNEITPAEEFLGIAESNIIPLLVAAVKELRSELNTLKASML